MASHNHVIRLNIVKLINLLWNIMICRPTFIYNSCIRLDILQFDLFYATVAFFIRTESIYQYQYQCNFLYCMYVIVLFDKQMSRLMICPSYLAKLKYIRSKKFFNHNNRFYAIKTKIHNFPLSRLLYV